MKIILDVFDHKQSYIDFWKSSTLSTLYLINNLLPRLDEDLNMSRLIVDQLCKPPIHHFG